MRWFVIKLFMFTIPPIMLFIIPPIAALWFVGEIHPFQTVVEEQLNSEGIIIYDPPFIETGIYKRTMIVIRQSDIVILGSSRVLTFRDQFCAFNPRVFYNAGIRTLDILLMPAFEEDFLSAYKPDLLILALDQPGFNGGYQRQWTDLPLNTLPAHQYQARLTNIRFDLQTLAEKLITTDKTIFQQIFDQIEPVYGHGALGFNATINGVGYRPDGSFQYGTIEATVNRTLMGSRFDIPNWVFTPGTEINTEALSSLDAMLRSAYEKDIEVIGFFPPFEPTIYNRVIAGNLENWTYLELAAKMIQNLFSRYDFNFYDFTNPESLGLTYETMLDDWHLSERGSLTVFQKLVSNQPSTFANCTSSEVITSQLQSSDHPWVIFDDTSHYQ